jgi:hypothetical protein
MFAGCRLPALPAAQSERGLGKAAARPERPVTGDLLDPTTTPFFFSILVVPSCVIPRFLYYYREFNQNSYLMQSVGLL